jgi:hypothetical protein
VSTWALFREPGRKRHVPEALEQVLRRYTEGKEGYLFTTRGAEKRGDRFDVLRRAAVPENLIKLWLGHSQNFMDLYAAQLRHDVAYRREWCESGLGI